MFSISNENLNAKFLSRFIARRLQYGLYIKQILNPIIKDLLITNQLSRVFDLNEKNNKIQKFRIQKFLKKYIYFFKNF